MTDQINIINLTDDSKISDLKQNLDLMMSKIVETKTSFYHINDIMISKNDITRMNKILTALGIK